MNIYCELKKNRIRLKIGSEETEIKIRPDFYAKIKGTETYLMFRDKATNAKIGEFIARHRSKLGLFGIFRYMFLRNRALVMLDREVQELMTIRLADAWATLSLDARVVHIVKRPVNFVDSKLEDIESICETGKNNGSNAGVL